jgi:hypothetical protein
MHGLEFFEAEFVGAEGTVMHARLLHRSSSSNPRDRLREYRRNARPQLLPSGLLLVNARLAKPIQHDLVYSGLDLIRPKDLLQCMRFLGLSGRALAFLRRKIGGFWRDAPSPIRAAISTALRPARRLHDDKSTL